jgi:hypothetical protein
MSSDLWGADGTQNSSAPYPGDNGNWTSWDDYLTQWISDMNANHATAGLSVDIVSGCRFQNYLCSYPRGTFNFKSCIPPTKRALVTSCTLEASGRAKYSPSVL